VNLAFDICTGIGVAAAVGIRPFLPALAVGAMAAGDIQIDFAHTTYSFLETAPFLLVMVFGVVLLAVTERRSSLQSLDSKPVLVALGAISVVVGALLFAGSLAQGHYTAWPGLIGGAICALVGILATLPLLARVRARLDAQSAGFVPLFSEAAAVISAVLSVLLPPVGVLVLALLLWLLFAGRRRSEQKYAGLRILR
jgi:uncharacterized membrane protein YgdD (TMEM256/DUF423 family)